MATELVTFKIEKDFLKEIDDTVKRSKYHNRTEFIRESLREKVSDIRIKRSIEELSKLKGSAKKKITDEEYEKVREEAFNEISRKLK